MEKQKRKQNPWIKHLMAEKDKHPELKFSEIMKLAKGTYKKEDKEEEKKEEE